LIPAFLVPETTVNAQGAGPVLDLGSAVPLLVTLGILEVVEQESLNLELWESADGANWSTKPLAKFPQKFYKGTHQLIAAPGTSFLQARWHVNRWGRGDMTPHFRFYVFIEPQGWRCLRPRRRCSG